MPPPRSTGARQAISLVPKTGSASQAASIPQVDGGSPPKSRTGTGTDFSLPPEIESALKSALDEQAGFGFELANTRPMFTDNIRFHRIRGKSDSRERSVALLYVDEDRLEQHTEAWCVYSFCVRICKAFKSSDADSLSIVFLAPSSEIIPKAWERQGVDLVEIGALTAVKFLDAGTTDDWSGASYNNVMQIVRDWIPKDGFFPLRTATTGSTGLAVADSFVSGPASQSSPFAPTASPSSPAPVGPKVFISYAKEDEAWKARLLDLIKPLKKEYPSAVWSDDQIDAGEYWEQRIQASLESARIVICLVSGAFLASEFINRVEARQAFKDQAKGLKTILWVYLSSCQITSSEFWRIQAAHDIDVPLDMLKDYGDQQEQLNKVTSKLKAHLDRLFANTPGSDRPGPT